MSHRYRNFGRTGGSQQKPEDPKLEAIEEQKLQSFEAGFQAGWDDALKAQAETKNHITEELAQNLQQMSFSYHEALSKVANSMEPLLKEIIDKLLPEIVRNALAAHILEQLSKMMADQIDLPIEIVVARENVETVREIAGPNLQEPFDVVGDGSVGAGQAFVRVGDSERQIDLDGVVSGVSDAMTAFFHDTKQESTNE